MPPYPTLVGAGWQTPFPICPTVAPVLALPLAGRRVERYPRTSGAASSVELRDHRMDIEAWLQGLGLERYAPAFRDNEIDWEVLPKLTSEDLREIGVAAVGHRRKLLDAIAALGSSAPIAAVSAAVSGA